MKLHVVEIEKGKPRLRKDTPGTFTKDDMEEIAHNFNSHEKLVAVVRNLVSSATKYPDDYATKNLNELIPYLIKEAKQALKQAEKREND